MNCKNCFCLVKSQKRLEMKEKTKIEKLNEVWSDAWDKRDILQEIGTLKRDHARPYVLKYLPRNGIHLEAGFGLGRYIFYLSDLGFNIVGIDVSKKGLQRCKSWAEENRYNPNIFKYGDVRDIPYPDNYFASYLSFGVIEHFEEGPYKALSEAYRVLRPGGIAIISIPNIYAYNIPIEKMGTKLKTITRRSQDKGFYQYEFSVNELSSFIQKAGFQILERQYECLKWPVYSILTSFPGGLKILRALQPVIFPLLDFMERTPLRVCSFGSLIVAIKPSDNPYCFFCGEVVDYEKIKHDFSVPICVRCMKEIPDKILFAYKRDKNVCFETRNSYKFSEAQLSLECKVKKEFCFFCNKYFNTNKYFGDYSFSVPVCPKCLRDPLKNLELCNYHLKYAWFEM